MGEAQKFNALIYILPGEDGTFDSYEVTSLDPNESLSLPNSGQLYWANWGIADRQKTTHSSHSNKFTIHM